MLQNTKLVFYEEYLRPLVQRLSDSKTLIVTDAYNYPLLHDIRQTVLVLDQEIEHIEKTKRDYKYENVIAVGGCTALDFGRACAVKKEITVIPTILSNSCISMDQSVIKRNGAYKSEKTIAPKETIISMPTIINNHEDQKKHWSASGVGDLFSAISASIEFEYQQNNNSFVGVTDSIIRSNVPSCVEALKWAVEEFYEFNRPSLIKLAHYLHDASLDVILNKGSHFNAASEHWLYYQMQEEQQYSKMLTTHGQMVSMGNLLTLRIFGEKSGDFSLYNTMCVAHKKIGLPLTYEDLRKINIEKNHITEGINGIEKSCLYFDYFKDNNYSILDRIFLN